MENAECSKINSIYDYMVADSPFFKDIARDVLKFIGDSTVVCHNAEFDLSFISKELFDNFQIKNRFYYIDTLKIARQYFSFQSNALGRLADILGIEVEISHRAMADVMTMFEVSKYLFANLFRKGIDTIEPLIFE
jgi:DNA polymerase-3 subunit epsilon